MISQSLTMTPFPLPVKVDVGIHCLKKGGIPLPHEQHIWGDRIRISHFGGYVSQWFGVQDSLNLHQYSVEYWLRDRLTSQDDTNPL